MLKIRIYLLKGLLAVFGALPLKVHYFFARILAWLAEDVLRYRTDVVMSNLALCFPEKSHDELMKIRKGFYRHFGEIIAEAIWFGGCRNAERLRKARIVEIVNPEELRRLCETAPSCMLLYSHTGNWELYGGMESYNYTDVEIPCKEKDICAVYRRLSNKVWDAVMKDNRAAPLKDKKGHEGYLESSRIIRYAYEHKDEKKIYNLNTDQRPYFKSAGYISLDFFGHPVRIMAGGAALAHKFHMSVSYGKMHRLSQGHYSLEYITICDDASLMSVEEIMRKYYDLVEEEVREQPENYLWTHKRFA